MNFIDNLKQFPEERIRRNVPIFTTHVRNGKSIDEKALQTIVANSKANEANGIAIPVHVGFMMGGGPDPPDTVGWAINLRIGMLRNRAAVFADIYYAPGSGQKVADNRFRSVEYYPSRQEISAVALLPSDPQTDAVPNDPA